MGLPLLLFQKPRISPGQASSASHYEAGNLGQVEPLGNARGGAALPAPPARLGSALARPVLLQRGGRQLERRTVGNARNDLQGCALPTPPEQQPPKFGSQFELKLLSEPLLLVIRTRLLGEMSVGPGRWLCGAVGL